MEVIQSSWDGHSSEVDHILEGSLSEAKLMST